MEEYKIIDHYLMIRLPEEIDHNSCKKISRRADHMLLDNEVSHVVFDFSDTKFGGQLRNRCLRAVSEDFVL